MRKHVNYGIFPRISSVNLTVCMPTVSRSKIVPYRAEDMFELVDSIEDYPKYLPWCRHASVMSRTEDEVRASITLAKGAVQKSFSTCNRIQRGKMIEIKLLNGPFRHLEGFWRFENLEGQGCRISLDLEFEFATKLLSLAISPIFTPIANSLVDSFCKRAADVYSRVI